MTQTDMLGLEHKYMALGQDVQVTEGNLIEGYASYFGIADRGQDVVQPGAYAKSLERLAQANGSVKMLWQHDPAQPIGVWDAVHEDERGLYVKGRILSDVEKGREALALIEAGAIDGLSIVYRTVKATKNDKGQRLLSELELWEASLVTFPMLPEARVGAKGDEMDPRCLIPRFDGVILSLEWKEAFWDKFVMGAPRPRTQSEHTYSNRKLRSRS